MRRIIGAAAVAVGLLAGSAAAQDDGPFVRVDLGPTEAQPGLSVPATAPAAASGVLHTPSNVLCGAQDAPATRERRVAYARVTDGHGTPLTDLSADEFRVAEDRVESRVVSATIGTEPMKVALLVDNGEAMRAAQAVNPMRDALAAFLEALPPQHLVGLFTIGGQVRQLVDFTTDRAALLAEARAIFTDEADGARFVDSIRETLDRRYNKGGAWPVFVALLTDSPEASAFLNDRRYRRFLSTLRDHGAMVHAVQWNSARRARSTPPFNARAFERPGAERGFAPPGRRRLVERDAGGRGTSATHTLALSVTDATGGRYVSVAAATGMAGAMATLATDMGAHYERVSTEYKVVYERPDPPGERFMMRIARPDVELQIFPDQRIDR